MEYLLVSTTQESYSRGPIQRLIRSLHSQVLNDYFLNLIIVEQNTLNPVDKLIVEKYDNLNIHRILGNDFIGLSLARNIGIDYSLNINCNCNSSKLILFPDDDCWYPDDFFSELTDLYSNYPYENSLTLSFGVFDPIQMINYGRRSVNKKSYITLSNVHKPISVGLVFSSSIFEKFGLRFNNLFGAGALSGAGEETLLLAEIISLGLPILQLPDLRVFHLNRGTLDPIKDAKYKFGSVLLSLYILQRFKNLSLLLYEIAYAIFCLLKYCILLLSGKSFITYRNRFISTFLAIFSFPYLRSQLINQQVEVNLILKGGLGNQIFQLFAVFKIQTLFPRTSLNIDLLPFLFDRKRDPLFQVTFTSIACHTYQRIVLKVASYLGFSFSNVVTDYSSIFKISNTSQLTKPLILNGFYQDFNPLENSSYTSMGKVLSLLEKKCNNLILPEYQFIAIHVRRSDFMDPNSGMTLIDDNYYLKAINILLSENVDLRIIHVFSDDIAWCKKYFCNSKSHEFIFMESNDPIYDLLLMSHASIVVAANSSFSIAASLFSYYRKKLIKLIIPHEWTNDNSERLSDIGLSSKIPVVIL